MNASALKQSLAILVLAILFVSCEKPETPAKAETPNENGTVKPANGSISYFAKASGTAPKGSKTKTAQVLADSTYVQWSSASIFVEKISFVGRNGSLLDTTIWVRKNLDILNTDVLTGVFSLPAGSYRDVKVKLFLRKANYPELAFNLGGTFISYQGTRDSLIVASSLPFEADLAVNDIIINASDSYKVVFNFNLDKVLAGISMGTLQSLNPHVTEGKRIYTIWKGGPQDVPFFNQVAENWQTVASAVISKQ
ncbi:hypothetical protein [Desertivirga xinjiangensis]|uniref:hypothetical protein n=1 Tax=Desertivirga xinjiangensis TaxID=539206 RepID=UPI00210C91A0|nr:hypothetical protein [Pedobacter xinjiangensis]